MTFRGIVQLLSSQVRAYRTHTHQFTSFFLLVRWVVEVFPLFVSTRPERWLSEALCNSCHQYSKLTASLTRTNLPYSFYSYAELMKSFTFSLAFGKVNFWIVTLHQPSHFRAFRLTAYISLTNLCYLCAELEMTEDRTYSLSITRRMLYRLSYPANYSNQYTPIKLIGSVNIFGSTELNLVRRMYCNWI